MGIQFQPVEVICKKHRYMIGAQVITHDGRIIVRVSPCPRCIKEAQDQIYHEGGFPSHE